MIARGYFIFTLLAISVRPHPVPSDNTRNEDVKVMRCIMEVVASALSELSTTPSSQECRDVLMGDERIASILRHQNLVQELQEVAARGTDADSAKQGLDEDPLQRDSSEEEEENEETQRLDEKSTGVHNRAEEEEEEETVHGEGPLSRKMLKEEERIPGSNRKEAGHQQSQEALHSSKEEESNRSPKGHVIKNPARGEEEEGSTSRRMEVTRSESVDWEDPEKQEDSEMEPLSAMESELEKMAQRLHKLRRG